MQLTEVNIKIACSVNMKDMLGQKENMKLANCLIEETEKALARLNKIKQEGKWK